jgi:hypothetical protein
MQQAISITEALTVTIELFDGLSMLLTSMAHLGLTELVD